MDGGIPARPPGLPKHGPYPGYIRETCTRSPFPFSALRLPLEPNTDSLTAQMQRLELARAIRQQEALDFAPEFLGAREPRDTTHRRQGEAPPEPLGAPLRPFPCSAGRDRGASRLEGAGPCIAGRRLPPLILGGGLQEVPACLSPSDDGLSPSPRTPREGYTMPRMEASIFVMRKEQEPLPRYVRTKQGEAFEAFAARELKASRPRLTSAAETRVEEGRRGALRLQLELRGSPPRRRMRVCLSPSLELLSTRGDRPEGTHPGVKEAFFCSSIVRTRASRHVRLSCPSRLTSRTLEGLALASRPSELQPVKRAKRRFSTTGSDGDTEVMDAENPSARHSLSLPCEVRPPTFKKSRRSPR
ncbi:hypothetical protein cyc_04042 [Cyclospora cayetanensis]|uniref:Uncharacterized protein n=1 Tax=Cyclospora cayetanensis TaxID=88456 RepID=A0A1D3D5W8_9EIME|nr:hypothetical protein cyc_04042 [Cyclospora cayetanensis]